VLHPELRLEFQSDPVLSPIKLTVPGPCTKAGFRHPQGSDLSFESCNNATPYASYKGLIFKTGLISRGLVLRICR
jgi:hypothetical protein